jgi:hypothetical protein
MLYGQCSVWAGGVAAESKEETSRRHPSVPDR